MRANSLIGLVCSAALAGVSAGSSAIAQNSATPPAADAALSARPSLSEPSLSPDGSMIAFVSGGDIWEVPAVGGIARLLVTGAATEGRPLYSPDGKTFAYDRNL